MHHTYCYKKACPYKPAPPPASQHPAHTRKSQEVTPPPRWETVPAEHRRYLGQVLARVIIRHSLLTIQEVPEDCARSPPMSTQGRWSDNAGTILCGARRWGMCANPLRHTSSSLWSPRPGNMRWWIGPSPLDGDLHGSSSSTRSKAKAARAWPRVWAASGCEPRSAETTSG